MSQRILLLLLFGPLALAQEGVPATSNVIGAQYPRILPDDSVIFRIKAASAKEVTIGEYKLTKSDDGFWTVRTKPFAPGFHYYSVVVDGFAATDPGSQTLFGALRQSSGIEIPGPESYFFAVKDVPHGGAFSFTRRLITTKTRVHDIRFSICSRAWARTKADGPIRATRTSSWIT